MTDPKVTAALIADVEKTLASIDVAAREDNLGKMLSATQYMDLNAEHWLSVLATAYRELTQRHAAEMEEARRSGFYAGFAYHANGGVSHVHGAYIYLGVSDARKTVEGV